jgi:hypothetical protein
MQSGFREVYRLEVDVRLTGALVDDLELYCSIMYFATSKRGLVEWF